MEAKQFSPYAHQCHCLVPALKIYFKIKFLFLSIYKRWQASFTLLCPFHGLIVCVKNYQSEKRASRQMLSNKNYTFTLTFLFNRFISKSTEVAYVGIYCLDFSAVLCAFWNSVMGWITSIEYCLKYVLVSDLLIIVICRDASMSLEGNCEPLSVVDVILQSAGRVVFWHSTSYMSADLSNLTYLFSKTQYQFMVACIFWGKLKGGPLNLCYQIFTTSLERREPSPPPPSHHAFDHSWWRLGIWEAYKTLGVFIFFLWNSF